MCQPPEAMHCRLVIVPIRLTAGSVLLTRPTFGKGSPIAGLGADDEAKIHWLVLAEQILIRRGFSAGNKNHLIHCPRISIPKGNIEPGQLQRHSVNCKLGSECRLQTIIALHDPVFD